MYSTIHCNNNIMQPVIITMDTSVGCPTRPHIMTDLVGYKIRLKQLRNSSYFIMNNKCRSIKVTNSYAIRYNATIQLYNLISIIKAS